MEVSIRATSMTIRQRLETFFDAPIRNIAFDLFSFLGLVGLFSWTQQFVLTQNDVTSSSASRTQKLAKLLAATTSVLKIEM
jgi:hypothetical protein